MPSDVNEREGWRLIEELTPAHGDVLLFYPQIERRDRRFTQPAMMKVGLNNVPRQATHWRPLPEPPHA